MFNKSAFLEGLSDTELKRLCRSDPGYLSNDTFLESVHTIGQDKLYNTKIILLLYFIMN